MTLDKQNAARIDQESLFHPFTSVADHLRDGPLVISEGSGVRVKDIRGQEYLDGMAGLWCVNLGYGRKEISDAIAAQSRKLSFFHAFNSMSTDVAIECADALLARAPVPMARVFFGVSGSDANETQLKLIWYYNNLLGRPRKKKIISRWNAYHGSGIATASLTGLPGMHTLFDLPLGPVLHLTAPHHYRQAPAGMTELQFSQHLAKELESVIEREGADTIAAFFAEPVMGAGGVIVPPATYFDRIQPILKKYEILFVVDEVICAFARTGNMFGAQTFNLQPDIMTLAKALSAGYQPISANLITNKLYEVLVAQSDKLGIFGHGYTYSAHPVPAAVALETLKIYEERDIVGKVRQVAPRMQAGIRSYADHPLIGDARGIGLIGAVELVRDKATKQSFDPKAGVAAYLVRRAQHHGAILRNMPGDNVAFCPPLIISEAEIDEMMGCFGKALDDTWAMVKERGLA